jgi:hypothetical protein
MKHTIITATDTHKSLVVKHALTNDLIHTAALAWIRCPERQSDLGVAIINALGTRSRLRRYVIDRSMKPVVFVRYTSYKRPEVLIHRGFPARFIENHAAIPVLQFIETDYPITRGKSFVELDAPPEEFVIRP